MPDTNIIAILLMLINGIISYIGFSNEKLLEASWFEVGKISKKKQLYRLITSGFVHVNGIHLAVNMYILFMFASDMEYVWEFNGYELLLIYFGALLMGNLLSLLVNIKKPDYVAVGASGAVSGVVLSHIIADPIGSIGIRFVPNFDFPAWIFGVFFIGYSIVGVRLNKGRVGHAAHLGGALTGALITLLLRPHIIPMRVNIIAGVFLPGILFFLIIIYKPELLGLDKKN